MNKRTRIKICGLTRAQDVRVVVEAGADAVGFVFYPPSSRFVTPDAVALLLQVLPPFVMSVGLFVNVNEDELRATIAKAFAGLARAKKVSTVASSCDSVRIERASKAATRVLTRCESAALR